MPLAVRIALCATLLLRVGPASDPSRAGAIRHISAPLFSMPVTFREALGQLVAISDVDRMIQGATSPRQPYLAHHPGGGPGTTRMLVDIDRNAVGGRRQANQTFEFFLFKGRTIVREATELKHARRAPRVPNKVSRSNQCDVRSGDDAASNGLFLRVHVSRGDARLQPLIRVGSLRQVRVRCVRSLVSRRALQIVRRA